MTYAVKTEVPMAPPREVDSQIPQPLGAMAEVWGRFKDVIMGRVAVLDQAAKALIGGNSMRNYGSRQNAQRISSSGR